MNRGRVKSLEGLKTPQGTLAGKGLGLEEPLVSALDSLPLLTSLSHSLGARSTQAAHHFLHIRFDSQYEFPSEHTFVLEGDFRNKYNVKQHVFNL